MTKPESPSSQSFRGKFKTGKMIFTSFVFALLFAFSRGAAESGSDDEIPFVIASSGSSDDKGSSLEPEVPPLSFQAGPSVDSRGRSDIEIEEEKPFGGYFYPRPGKAFDLPAFKTLEAEVSFPEEGSAEEKERAPRSAFRPQRPLRPLRPPRPPRYPSYRPIRPLPALYDSNIPHVY